MAAGKVKVGIIGGTGIDDPDILEGRQEKTIITPFGSPSDNLVIGKIKEIDCVLIARHGRKHTVTPTHINYRANIYALEQEGCTHVVVTTACGSLKEDYRPGDIVFPDQFIDRTNQRESTFYDGKEGSHVGVCHIPMHEPYCPELRKILIDVARDLGLTHHEKGVNVVIEGPRFSSKAESKMFRIWGGDIINMTAMPEVALANEKGLCYAAIAMVTDYDSWHDDHEPVSVEAVLKTFKSNVSNAIKIILECIPRIAQKDWTHLLKKKADDVKSSTMLPKA
ncbi:S-methyl-5'-thioadenosine phosphorylase-like [Actinia tenebrosa]|uniref:S-methyl-5'-thioadenosine phosphorylase n=1 Tax=Actinia tenebrosa TaxID=6105 RepID=A0A6P8I522_ACTTE|nr:S-methyl-5'-thioadenosine phosphorylase-like [Actinia tenebrosa]